MMENAYKETSEEKKPDEKAPESKSSKLSTKAVDGYLRFIIFLAAIGMVYIWNSHTAEKQVRKMERLKTEIKDLRSEYTTLSADLSYGTKLSSVTSLVDTLGLSPLEEPAIRLKRKEK